MKLRKDISVSQNVGEKLLIITIINIVTIIIATIIIIIVIIIILISLFLPSSFINVFISSLLVVMLWMQPK